MSSMIADSTDPTEDLSCNADYDESRSEPRYLCVGMPLLYSALSNQNVNNLAEKIYNAFVVDMSLSGMAFDMKRAVETGTQLVILLDKPDGAEDDELLCEVRWCKKQASGNYRVGVAVKGEVSPEMKQGGKLRFSGSRLAPSEVETSCPACQKKSTFQYSGEQPILNHKAKMFLYDCSQCGTTRSLLTILDKHPSPDLS